MSSEQTPNQAAMTVRAPMAQAQQQMAITPAEIMRILLARMWLIAGLTIGVFVIFLGLFFVLRQTAPEYTSEAYVRAQAQASIGQWGVRESQERKEIIAMQTAQVSAILNSDAFFGDVLKRSEVQRSSWAARLSPDKRIDGLRKNFSATPMRDTALVKLVFKAATPEETKEILDRILTQFEVNVIDDAKGSLNSLKTSLTTSMSNIESLIVQAENGIKTLTGDSDVPPGWQGGGMTVVSQEIQILNEEIIRLEVVLSQLGDERQQLLAQQEAGGLEQITLMLEQDPVALGIKQQIMSLEQLEAQKLGRFGEKHPEVIDIRDAIKSAKYQLADRQKQMSENYTGQLINDNARQIVLITNQLAGSKEKYNRVKERQIVLDRKALDYAKLTSQRDRLTEQLAKMRESLDQITTQINSNDNLMAVVYSKANVPTELSFPKLPMFVAGGVVLGLMAGCGLAFLLELLNDTVRTPTDVRRYLNVPLLGLVPEYDQGDVDDLAKILISRPSCITSEFIRQSRTNLLFSAPSDSLRTLLFTSCQAESGKTTMACCMAISLAQDNKKVLLIDANFYRPALKGIFPSASVSGLSNYLTGQDSIAEVIHDTEVPNLSVMYSGPKPPNPAGLFGGKYMVELIRSQRDAFDYVIIDGPPSLIVLDARVISSIVDGTVAVVFAEEESRGMVNRMIRELKQMKANIVGVLLNGAQYRKGGYFKKTYKTYHDYVEGETESVN